MSSHLTARDFLLYADGELPRWRTRRIRRHLDSCWNCRRGLERLEQDIGAIVDAQNRAFLPSLPRPTRPWRGFDEMAAALPSTEGRDAGRLLRQPLSWAVAVAAVAVAIVISLWIAPARLSAAGVLQNVARADSQRAGAGTGIVRQGVLIERMDRRSAARHAVTVRSWKSGDRVFWKGDDESLRSRYVARGLDAALPMSSTSWQKLLQDTGSPAELSREGGKIELRAGAENTARDLESVALRITPGNWHVEAMRLTFADSIFDLRETDFAVVERAEVPAEVLAALDPRTGASLASLPPDRAPVSDAPAPAAPEREHRDIAERRLAVEFRLHQIGADLSEPIEVSISGEGPGARIAIHAAGAAPGRQQQLTQMFGADPDVHLDLDARPGALGDSPLAFAAGAGLRSEPDPQVIEFLGGAEPAENFTQAILRADAPVLARLYALRRIAEQWPPGAEAALSADGRAQLRTMVEDHGRALDSAIPELRRLVAPLLQKFCAPATAAATAPSAWRASSAAALQAARRTDRLLRVLLTTSSNSTRIAAACPDLSDAFGTLEAAAANLRSRP